MSINAASPTRAVTAAPEDQPVAMRAVAKVPEVLNVAAEIRASRMPTTEVLRVLLRCARADMRFTFGSGGHAM